MTISGSRPVSISTTRMGDHHGVEAALTSAVPIPDIQILLAGDEAAEAAAALAQRPGSANAATVEVAPTLLHAVMMAQDPRLAGLRTIGAGVSREMESLESATRALRKVYPAARIYLLCDPADEVRCRRAVAWGADDYLLMPLDAAGIALLTQTTQPAHPDPDRARPAASASLAAQPLTLPAELHAELLRDLAAGHTDIAQRAVQLLQGQFPWPGQLRFVPVDPGQSERHDSADPHDFNLRLPIHAGPAGPLTGTLILESDSAAQPASFAGDALRTAASYLGSLLAVTRRCDQLRSLAITDELSGAYNRRYFTKFVSNLLDRARENRFRVTLLMFDIDDFKKYNDRFGHASGDAIIRELIKLLRACTRPHDLVARVGGDEFAVVFWDNEAPRQPNSQHPRDALAATERFRKAVQTHEWPAACHIQGDVSISGGLASFPWDADSLEELMARADEALLRAKAAGKNAIVLHAGNCPPAAGRDVGSDDASDGADTPPSRLPL